MIEAELYGRAHQIITIAMGQRTMGKGRGKTYHDIADDDPLAYFLGVQSIVDLVREVEGSDAEQEDKGQEEGPAGVRR